MSSCRAKLLVAWLGVMASSADDVACALQKPLGKTKIHDNYVSFAEVLSVQFSETSHSITDGQPYEGVSTVDGYRLDVRAGRHESSEVADDFNAGISGDNALGLYTMSDSLPEELNFALFGTLSVTIDDTTRDCQEIRLAQGHRSPDMNNWWLAGTQCVHLDSRGLKCACGGSNVNFAQPKAPPGPSNSKEPLGRQTFFVSFDS